MRSVRLWNEPMINVARKLTAQLEDFPVGEIDSVFVAAGMVGFNVTSGACTACRRLWAATA